MTSTRSYERAEVVSLIRREGIDVMVIVSPWPETCRFTLTECVLAGVPAIVGPHGAPAERVQATGAGLVMPDLHVQTFVAALLRLAGDADTRAQLQAAARTAASLLPPRLPGVPCALQ